MVRSAVIEVAAVNVVNVPAAAVVAPIIELLIVPPEIVRSSATFALGRTPDTSAVARSTAVVNEPVPTNIEAVKVSETSLSAQG